MAKLVFLRRTEKEIQVFGGDVYIDIDGKNVGILSRVNQEYEVSTGQHTIKMYKSHSYDTYIGFAESTITVDENEQLMVRYAAPMAANQPGNLIISPYDPTKENELLRARESAIQRDVAADEHRKQEQNNKYNTGWMIFIAFLVIDAIIWAIWMASI
ncbi:MAG TPA: hypothetical protein VFD28_02275 [Candidatus Eisenbacteria bacterium]|nr:hypothetical protein [Candidatus Eisenbacteria bacterium]